MSTENNTTEKVGTEVPTSSTNQGEVGGGDVVSTPKAAQAVANQNLRDLILNTKKPRKTCTLWGQEVEIEAGSIGEAFDDSRDTVRKEIRKKLQKELGGVEITEELIDDEIDFNEILLERLIKHAYVPGTDQLVFTLEDKDLIRSLPDDGSFTVFLNTFRSLSDINVDEAAKKSEGIQSS